MSEHETVEAEEGLSRRDVLVRGGLLTAGATLLGSPAAAFAAAGATEEEAAAAAIKVAVVTHGDTGAFWSVFKKGVDQAAKGRPEEPRRQRHAGLRQQRRREAGQRIERRGRGRREGDRDVRPGRQRAQGPLTKASQKGIEIIVNSGLGSFDNLPTYMVHIGRRRTSPGRAPGSSSRKPARRSSSSSSTRRATSASRSGQPG